MIETEKIGAMRYATDAASAVNLYSTGAASGLTLGQLVMAVCLNTAASYEKQSVNKMNTVTKNSDLLLTASDWIEKVVADNASWSRLKRFLVNELGVAEASLPEKIRSYDDRLKVISLMTAILRQPPRHGDLFLRQHHPRARPLAERMRKQFLKGTTPWQQA